MPSADISSLPKETPISLLFPSPKIQYARTCKKMSTRNFAKSTWPKVVNINGAMKQRAENAVDNVHKLLSDLKSCGTKRDIQWGRRIHVEAFQNTFNIHVASALMKMYARCGSMVEAHDVFHKIQRPDVVSWNVIIFGYADNGEGYAALNVFSEMKAQGYNPDAVTYVAALKACIALAVKADDTAKVTCLEQGRKIHSEVGCHLNHYVQARLVEMYVKCGSILEARHVFEGIESPHVVSWTAMILGYADVGKGDVALEMFSRMKECGCIPDSVTYVAAVKACTSLTVNGKYKDCLEQGRKIHSEIGCLLNQYVQNGLIDMYAKAGSMLDARSIFEGMQAPDVVSWNALLLGYVENGEGHVCLDLFSKMKCRPSSVTYVALLKACTSLAVLGNATESLARGRKVHSEIACCELNRHVQSALIDMYAKCRSMVDARRVFESIEKPNTVSWTALLMGYADNGEGHTALDLFTRMKASGCPTDSLTYVAVLKAYSSLAAAGDDNAKVDCLERGRRLHLEIGSHLDQYVENMLIDMYSKCGSMLDAHNVFDKMQKRSVVSWTALLMGYADNENGYAALDMFSKMRSCGFLPDIITYVAALKACGLVGDLPLGRKLHLEIREFSAHVVTSLVDFYGKCGSMAEAREVFDVHAKARCIATWNALLDGYSSVGDSHSVFSLFESMQDEGCQPDEVTFLCLLSCCSHAGLVKDAQQCFDAMHLKYHLTPTTMHYNCMVDCLGRANQLQDAIALVRKVPCSPDAITWRILLGASRKWKNVEIGIEAFQALVSLDKANASDYILMGHLCGAKGIREKPCEMISAV